MKYKYVYPTLWSMVSIPYAAFGTLPNSGDESLAQAAHGALALEGSPASPFVPAPAPPRLGGGKVTHRLQLESAPPAAVFMEGILPYSPRILAEYTTDCVRYQCALLQDYADLPALELSDEDELELLLILAQTAENRHTELQFRQSFAVLYTALQLAKGNQIAFRPEAYEEGYSVTMADISSDTHLALSALSSGAIPLPQQAEYALNVPAVLYADPYLMDYNASIDDWPDPNLKQLEICFKTIKNVFKGGPNAKLNRHHLNTVFQRIRPLSYSARKRGYADAPFHPGLRKRIMRLWQTVELEPQEDQFIVATALSDAHERCADGISQALLPHETAYVFGAKSLSLGTQISQVIKAEIERFIDKHAHPGYREHNKALYDEHATEVVNVLRERLRLAMGIPGEFQLIKYPYLGYPEEEAFQPEVVLQRFFNGGALVYEEYEAQEIMENNRQPGQSSEGEGAKGQPATSTVKKEYKVAFEAFTPDRLITLVRNAYLTGNLSTFDTFCQEDPVLGPMHEKTFIDGESEANPYFSSSPNKEEAYKDAAFTWALVQYGYLIKNGPAA